MVACCLVAACTAPPSVAPVDGAVGGLPDASSATDGARPDAATDAGPDARVCPNVHAGVPPRGLWVWQNSIIGDAVAEDALFAFTDDKGIDAVFIQVALADMPAVGADDSELGRLIARADDHCVRVELLIGRGRWCLADYQGEVVAQATAAVAFTQALTGPKPTALHADVEPQQVRGITSGGVTWDWGQTTPDNHRPQIINQLLDNLAAVKAALGTTLPLHLDMGFFLDSTTPSTAINPFQRVIAGASVGAPGSAHTYLIDAADHVFIMDYRDTAFGSGTDAASSSNGMYDRAENEAAYALSRGDRQVTLGANTIPAAAGEEFTTYLEEGEAVMEAELGKLLTAYAGNAAVVGIAIHDYDGYAALAP